MNVSMPMRQDDASKMMALLKELIEQAEQIERDKAKGVLQ